MKTAAILALAGAMAVWGQTKIAYPVQIKQGPLLSDASDSPTSTLASNCATAATAGLSLSVTKLWTVPVGFNCAANLVFNGGRIRPANGVTVSFTSTISAPMMQIFDYSLGGTVVISAPQATVYPQWWGALANGSHDDSAALNAGYQSIFAAGGNLYLPPGNYKCSTYTAGACFNILNPHNNTQTPGVQGGSQVYGAGVGRTIISTTATSGVVVSAVSTGTTYYPFYNIHDLTIQGPDDFDNCLGGIGSPTGGGTGLRITGTAAPSIRLQNLLVTGFCGSGGVGIRAQGEEQQWDKVRANYNETGIQLLDDANSSLFNKITADQNIFGMQLSFVTGTTFTDLLIQSNYKTGLSLDGTAGNTFSSAYFEHNNFSSTSGEYALKMTTVNAGNTNNFFTSPTFVAVSDSVYLSGDSSPAHVTSGNYFLGIVPSAFQSGATVTLANQYATGNNWSGILTSNFVSDPTATETFLDSSSAFSSGARTAYFPQLVNRKYTLNISGDHTTTLGYLSHTSAGAVGTGLAGLGYWSIGTLLATEQGIWDFGEISRGQTVTFYQDGGNNTHMWWNYRASSSLTKGFGVILKSTHSIVNLTPSLFSGLPSCGDVDNAPVGSVAMVTDSTTVTWGDDITGSGSNAVTAVCNRSGHWTVMGK